MLAALAHIRTCSGGAPHGGCLARCMEALAARAARSLRRLKEYKIRLLPNDRELVLMLMLTACLFYADMFFDGVAFVGFWLDEDRGGVAARRNP